MVFAYIPHDVLVFDRYQGYQEATSGTIDIIFDIIFDIKKTLCYHYYIYYHI